LSFFQYIGRYLIFIEGENKSNKIYCGSSKSIYCFAEDKWRQIKINNENKINTYLPKCYSSNSRGISVYPKNKTNCPKQIAKNETPLIKN
jgi:hypothetical protein